MVEQLARCWLWRVPMGKLDWSDILSLSRDELKDRASKLEKKYVKYKVDIDLGLLKHTIRYNEVLFTQLTSLKYNDIHEKKACEVLIPGEDNANYTEKILNEFEPAVERLWVLAGYKFPFIESSKIFEKMNASQYLENVYREAKHLILKENLDFVCPSIHRHGINEASVKNLVELLLKQHNELASLKTEPGDMCFWKKGYTLTNLPKTDIIDIYQNISKGN